MAAPIPRDPPVTIATLLSTLIPPFKYYFNNTINIKIMQYPYEIKGLRTMFRYTFFIFLN